MAVNGADSARVNRVLTTTLDRYSPKISNEIARNDGVITAFAKDGRIIVAGGQRAIETLDVSENPNFGFRSRYTDIPIEKADTRMQAKYAWATIDGAVTINDVDKMMNMGESEIYSLVAADVNNAKNTMVRKVADALRASSPGASDPESVLTIIPDTATASQTTTTGELSRSTYSWWRSQYSNDSMDLSGANLEVLIAFIIQTCSKGTAKIDKPNLGLLNGTLYAALAYQAHQYKRWTQDAVMAKMGFDRVPLTMCEVIDIEDIECTVNVAVAA